MPTAIVLDRQVHVKHPDKNQETVCGIEYTDDETQAKAHSVIHYIDYVLETVRTRADTELKDECSECINYTPD